MSWQAAPTAAFYLASNNSKGQFNINCDNPLLTGQFISMFCPNGTVVDPGTGKPGLAQVDIARRNVEGGPRITEYRHTSYRMVVGAKAIWATAGRMTLPLRRATRCTVSFIWATGPRPPCKTRSWLIPTAPARMAIWRVPLDLFHGIGAVTPAMQKYVGTHGQVDGYTRERVVSANLTGDLGQYGIKSPFAKQGVSVAVGSEWRDEFLQKRPAPQICRATGSVLVARTWDSPWRASA